MKTLKKIFVWIKDHLVLVGTLLASVVIAVLYFMLGRSKKNEEILEHKNKILEASGEIRRLEGIKEAIKSSENVVDEEIKKLDDHINSLNAEIEDRKKKISEMSAEEKLDEFKDLGY